ncbi:MAG: hypothetical protein ACT4P7_04500 [Gemmatimonadaceae bacterium]
MMTRDDTSLRALYAQLQAARRHRAPAPSIPVETVQALADGNYHGPDREALLDQVLSDAGMHAEFGFFLDLARDAPARAGFRFPALVRPFALAASVVIVIALGSRLLTRDPLDDPLRGTDTGVALVVPGDAVRAGAVTFTWRALPGAVSYDLDVAREDGATVANHTTADTTARLTLEASGDAPFRWWVTARRDDGTSLRSSVRRLDVRPR